MITKIRELLHRIESDQDKEPHNQTAFADSRTMDTLRELSKVEFYSNCCGYYMGDWPDNDLCPKCMEHCDAMKSNENFWPKTS